MLCLPARASVNISDPTQDAVLVSDGVSVTPPPEPHVPTVEDNGEAFSPATAKAELKGSKNSIFVEVQMSPGKDNKIQKITFTKK